MIFDNSLEKVRAKHQELCLELNMDSETTEASWTHYIRASLDNNLEGDPTHWLCCALYFACRNTTTPTVGRPDAVVEGNCVSLTRLLRSCNITLHKFFKKMKEWIDMNDAHIEFRERIDRLSNSLAVSLLVYEKYRAIFKDLFAPLQTDEPARSKSSKKNKLSPCTINKVYEFGWYLFICAKGEYTNISLDLVTSYHILLCCVDLLFANVIAEKRKDLINSAFPAIPNDWFATTAAGDSVTLNTATPPSSSTASTPLCIMEDLCRRHDGTQVDAFETKRYAWKQIMQKYIEKNILKCNKETFLDILSTENFSFNLNSLKRLYEVYVLSVGEIDEGIILAASNDPTLKQTIETEMDESKKQFMPETPLTCRHSLPGKETCLTPVAMATQMVKTLRNHLGAFSAEPSSSLRDLLSFCVEDPLPKMKKILREMQEKFCNKLEANGLERFQLAQSLYYRLLENILRSEMTVKKNFDTKILNIEIFHGALIANSVEIVLFAYRAQQKFPWILDCFNIDAFHFYKNIEMIVLYHKDMLTRDVIKHLNSIEEQCLDSLAWKSSSPLWDQIAQFGNSLPGQQIADLPKQHFKNELIATLGVNASKQLFRSTSDFSTSFASSPAKQTNNNRTASPVPSTSSAASNHQRKDTNAESVITITPGTPNNRTAVKPGGSLLLFFRKFYKLAYLRILNLCENLCYGKERYTDEKYLQQIWTIFEYSITTQFRLMKDRHLDQILMCSIYVFGRNSKFDKTFKDIMTLYRKQPQATSDVYRDVHMTKNDIEYIQKQSTTNNETDTSNRYNIITFYNCCYVPAMQNFVTKAPDAALLSPLPPYTRHQNQSPIKVSENHLLFIENFEPRDFQQSPGSVVYSFKASPIESIDINSNGKRNLPFIESTDRKIIKATRLTVGNIVEQPSNTSSFINHNQMSNHHSKPYVPKKLQNLIKDRQENTDKREKED